MIDTLWDITGLLLLFGLILVMGTVRKDAE
jgi:hypothetical protein